MDKSDGLNLKNLICGGNTIECFHVNQLSLILIIGLIV